MKGFLKAIVICSISFLMVLTMTGCSEYNFYGDWHSAGANIEEKNIFVTISLEEAKAKKEAGDVFTLLYASSSSTQSLSVVSSLQAQAEYLLKGEVDDVVIYYVNSSEFNTSEKRTEVRTALGMHEAPSDGSPIIMTFKSGRVDVDTSDFNKVATKNFIVGNSIQYASLASYIFKELK